MPLLIRTLCLARSSERLSRQHSAPKHRLTPPGLEKSQKASRATLLTTRSESHRLSLDDITKGVSPYLPPVLLAVSIACAQDTHGNAYSCFRPPSQRIAAQPV